jgi:hypothetical protein
MKRIAPSKRLILCHLLVESQERKKKCCLFVFFSFFLSRQPLFSPRQMMEPQHMEDEKLKRKNEELEGSPEQVELPPKIFSFSYFYFVYFQMKQQTKTELDQRNPNQKIKG